MSSNTILRKLPSGFEQIYISDSYAALSRSHRLIRIEHQKECTFMSIFGQIKLYEFREIRSTNQREQRRQKRKKYQTS